MPKKGEYIRFKKFERERKSPFIIYADFVSILAPKDNEKQNFEESSTNNCQKHAACGYCYKSVCVDNKFSKCFKSYLGEDDLYILLIVWWKKLNTVLILRNKILTKILLS